jgi:diguanylate cyclase (GGDEF)-like protein
MTASKRNASHGALIFLDLDNFKPLNDTHGHHVGDLLLIEVAQRICACVRAVDDIARFGGDEFVVILRDLGKENAEATREAGGVAEKIRASLDQPYVLKIKPEGKAETSVEHQCSSSIGVALFLDHEVGAEQVIKWADLAMYQAKEAGGNQVRFFDA